MKKIKAIIPVLVFSVFLLFLFFSESVQKSAYESILFCGKVLIPSLFPGFVLSDMLIGLTVEKNSMNTRIFSGIFRLSSPCFRCWILGLLAGFPTAADCVCTMVRTGEISKEEGERCLAFTNNPGVVFVIGAVGSGIFDSLTLGIYLWFVQVFSAILIGILFAKPYTERKSALKRESCSLKKLFPKAVVSSVSSVLNICGFVVFFRVIIGLLTRGMLQTPVQSLISGLLEMTCGISSLGDASLFSVMLASFLLGWSGFSVHFQIINTVSSLDLSLRYYFPGKVLQALFSAVFAGTFYPLIVGEYLRFSFVLFTFFAVLTVFFIRFRKEYLYGKRNFSTRKTTS